MTTRSNSAMDSDNYSAPLRAPIIARHRGRLDLVHPVHLSYVDAVPE